MNVRGGAGARTIVAEPQAQECKWKRNENERTTSMRASSSFISSSICPQHVVGDNTLALVGVNHSGEDSCAS